MKKIMTVIALMGCASFAVTAQAAGDADAGAEKITTCVACHGKDGKAVAPIYPNIGGQSEQYLESSLKAYKAGERGGGMSAMMIPQAQNLSDEDIADLAAYYSSRNP